MISPEKIDQCDSFLAIIEGMFIRFHDSIFAFQLRVKPYNSLVIDLAIQIYSLCDMYNVLFILNDYLGVAVMLQKDDLCDGVHLGQKDLYKLDMCRKGSISKMKIGISCYDRVELAESASALGAYYVSFGAFFISRTKAITFGKPTVATLQEWLQVSGMPTVVIGGITSENCNVFIQFPHLIIAVSYCVWFHKKGALYGLEELIIKLCK